MSHSLRASLVAVAVAVLVSGLALGRAAAQPEPLDLTAKANGAANALEFWHDVKDDIAPPALYCEARILLRRILTEARDPNSDAAKRLFDLLGAQKLADELGEDDFLQYENYGDLSDLEYYYAFACPPEESPLRPTDQTVFGGLGGPTVFANVDFVDQHSTWTITSPFDRVRTTSDTPGLRASAEIDWGRFFSFGAATGAGNARGSFSDMFFGFPVTTTGTVNSGTNSSFTAGAGFNMLAWRGVAVDAFALYTADFESLYGTTALSAGANLSLLETHTQAAGAGLRVRDAFSLGNVPLIVSASAAGLADNVKSGAFNGNGGGWQANAMLTFPAGPVHGNFFIEVTHFDASSSLMGVPLTYVNRNLTFGGGLSGTFGP